MTILITSGSGTNGSYLAKALHALNWPILLTYRSRPITNSQFPSVRLDWNDPSTFSNPFEADKNIDRVFMTVPFILYPLEVVKPFIDLAVQKGVKRFVLLSATTYGKGKLATGHVHKYLSDIGVDFHVLRPTWYIENFLTSYLEGIKKRDEITTGTRDGKAAFVSVEDIAEKAKQALIAEKPLPNEDTIIVGPELLSYDDVAEILTDVLGRRIVHRQLTDEEVKNFWKFEFFEEDYSLMLVDLEELIRNGSEAAQFNAPNRYVGKVTVREFLERNKEKFALAN
ncbi:hypothetical protein AX16_007671 [Volvariella volvacea WC 439]|nr:hypothetical protein AX16_007671 [Volvariella volvacea WC 439]